MSEDISVSQRKKRQLSLWENFTLSGMHVADKIGIRQLQFINLFSLIGFLSVTYFGIQFILTGVNTQTGVADLIGAAVFIFNILTFRITKNFRLTKGVMLATQLTLLIVQLGTGGTSKTGIYWFFTFPLTAFFIMERKKGLLWMLVMYCATFATLYFSWLGVIILPYSFTEVRQMLVAVGVSSFLVYFYQQAIEKTEESLQVSNRELQEYFDSMKTLSAKISTEGKILMANKEAKEVTGMGEKLIGADFINGNWWTYDRKVHNRLQKEFHQALLGKSASYEEKAKLAGKLTSISFSLVPIIHKGKVSYILAEGRDITAFEETREELERFNKVMIDRELEMSELKKKILLLQKA